MARNGFCSIPECYKYDMGHERRGKAIIFNLYTEEDGGPTDVQNLRYALGARHRFEVEVYTNDTYGEIYQILCAAASEDYENCDCIMVVILAHGNNVGIRAKDQTFKTSQLWVPFTQCATLIGKPKIFLVQACRGEGRDSGALEADSSANLVILPRMADILVIYSCFEDHVSYITPSGTPFITEFCAELVKEENSELEFSHILTFVINKVAVHYRFSVDGRQITKQLPTYTSSLTRALYLAVKKN